MLIGTIDCYTKHVPQKHKTQLHVSILTYTQTNNPFYPIIQFSLSLAAHGHLETPKPYPSQYSEDVRKATTSDWT